MHRVMKYTLQQAAQAAGKSKSTILRAIKSGRLSATRTAAKHFLVDPSELHRVFPMTRHDAPESTPMTRHDAGNDAASLPGNYQWDRERKQMESTIEDLRRRLDDSEDERRRISEKLSGLLTHQPETERETKPTAGRWRKAWDALKDGW